MFDAVKVFVRGRQVSWRVKVFAEAFFRKPEKGGDRVEKNLIRIGRVSAVDYAAGAVEVAYHDRDDSVTAALPMLSSVYQMPAAGDLVLVLHLSSGSEAGVVLGRFYGDENPPKESGEGLFRVNFDREGNASIRCQNGEVLMTAGSFVVNGSLALAGDLTLTGNLAVSGSITAQGDITAGGVSLLTHVHTESGGADTGAAH